MSTNENFGLDPKTLASLIQVFARHTEIQKVVVYGSRAMGTYRPGSDIDLILEGAITDSTLVKLDGELDNLLLPYKFDISPLSAITNPKLLEHVQRVGKVLFQRGLPSSKQ